MSRTRIGSGSSFEELIGYSRAVVDGDWIFVAGTTGFDYASMRISEDVVAQAEQALRVLEVRRLRRGEEDRAHERLGGQEGARRDGRHLKPGDRRAMRGLRVQGEKQRAGERVEKTDHGSNPVKS